MDKISESFLKFLRLDTLVQNLSGYVEARIELVKVEIREDVAKAIARGLVSLALFFMGFLFLIFLSFGVAHSLNSFFEGPYAGFWIVAGIYGATFLLLLVFRKNLSDYFERYMTELIKQKKEK